MVNNLLASNVWGIIGSILLAILILLVMITIHEFGHYIAGKIFHFDINEFSIGFGPALFMHKNKKTEELFAVRLIPLGGYCAFAGEDGLDEEEEEKEKKQKADPFEAESVTPPEQRELDKETPEKEVDKSGYFTNRPCWQRIIVLIAGALMNYLLALVLIITCFYAYGQTMVAVYEADEATDQYIGYSLEDYDIILQVENKSIYLTADIAKALNGKAAGTIVQVRVSRAVNFEWKKDEAGNYITDENGNKLGKLDGREEVTVPVMLRSDVKVKNSADFDSVWQALGVKYEESEAGGGYMLANAVYRSGFWETLGRSITYSFKIAGSIFKVLGELLTGKLGLSAVGGPVTTIKMTSQIVSRGFRYFLEIAGYIGVNLAVFNLLPIPALDGSKVIFTAIEWVRGKPISRKVEAIIHAVGFVLLLGFAVLVDILQFVI